jgi:hypothetical protein
MLLGRGAEGADERPGRAVVARQVLVAVVLWLMVL